MKTGVIYDFKDANMNVRAALIAEKDGGFTGAPVEKCWPTKEECLRAEKERAELQVKEYEESIKSVEDLVKFLWENDVNSEYRDYDAAEAAKNRAKELLNIEL